MGSIETRIAALEHYVAGLRPELTTFILEDGTEFHTQQDAFDYLYEHGVVTPTGKRIAFYPHPIEGIDALSLSLYHMIDKAIETGNLELPELESDKI